MRWAKGLSDLSAYKRCDAHLTTKTAHGAIVTILGVLLGLTLTAHELRWYLNGSGAAKTAVDLARRHDLKIHIDISFPAIPCAGLSVDVMDASGSTGNDVSQGKDVRLHKIRLDGRGRRLGGRDGEYATPQSQKLVSDGGGTVMQIDLGAAMTQMGDMEREMQHHEGCRVRGSIVVRRVAGKLHFAVHQQSFVDVLPQMLTGHMLPHLTNMSHVIHKVAFGPEFPGQVNPLDGFSRVAPPGGPLAAYKYFLKIVPTEYLSRMGLRLETNQYSVNEYALPLAASEPPRRDGSADTAGDPGSPPPLTRDPFVDLSYDLSPIMMVVAQSPASLLHFVVRLCAVVGGVLSVTRMADKALHAALVAAGAVVPPPSVKARARSSAGGGGYGGSFVSPRPSLPGATDLLSQHSGSLPGSARSSFAGAGSLPGSGRSSYAGGGGLPAPPPGGGGLGGRGSASGFSSSGGLMADAAAGAYHRPSYPGSHPLPGLASGASSLAGGSLPGSHGGAPPPAPLASGLPSNGSLNGLLPAYSGGGSPVKGSAGSFGGAGLPPGGRLGSASSLGGGGGPPPLAGSGGSFGGAPPSGFASAPLAGPGGSPTHHAGQFGAGFGASRLATASGPGSRPASGPGGGPPAGSLGGARGVGQFQQ